MEKKLKPVSGKTMRERTLPQEEDDEDEDKMKIEPEEISSLIEEDILFMERPKSPKSWYWGNCGKRSIINEPHVILAEEESLHLIQP